MEHGTFAPPPPFPKQPEVASQQPERGSLSKPGATSPQASGVVKPNPKPAPTKKPSREEKKKNGMKPGDPDLAVVCGPLASCVAGPPNAYEALGYEFLCLRHLAELLRGLNRKGGQDPEEKYARLARLEERRGEMINLLVQGHFQAIVFGVDTVLYAANLHEYLQNS